MTLDQRFACWLAHVEELVGHPVNMTHARVVFDTDMWPKKNITAAEYAAELIHEELFLSSWGHILNKAAAEKASLERRVQDFALEIAIETIQLELRTANLPYSDYNIPELARELLERQGPDGKIILAAQTIHRTT